MVFLFLELMFLFYEKIIGMGMQGIMGVQGTMVMQQGTMGMQNRGMIGMQQGAMVMPQQGVMGSGAFQGTGFN